MRSSLFVRRALALSSIAALFVACGNSGGGGGTLTLVSTLPASGATNVPVESNVSATFSQAITSASTTNATFYLTPAATGAGVTVSGSVATLSHSTALQPNTMYTATLAASIADSGGATLGTDQSWTFTTAGIPDNTAPAKVTTLAAGSPTATTIALNWTAVGNDGTSGTATTYKLRYATGSGCPMTASNFSTATAITTTAPKAAGSAETAVATGLTPVTSYCFGLVVGDAAGNLSPLSNIATASTTATPDTTAPAAVTDLGATATSSSAVHLTWTAPGDDGTTGTALAYDVRAASGNACPILDATFSAATSVTTSAPQVAGSTESADATGLTPATDDCFALKTSDAAGNVSTLSNVATATTAAAPVGAISDLAVASVLGETITLQWTAPAHADSSATYDIYDVAGACPGDSSGFIAGATGHVSGVAANAASSAETHTITALAPRTAYCFGITLTDNGVTSVLSNLIGGTSGDDIAPGTVSSITVGTVTISTVQLSWTAPGNDGATTGSVTSYDLRYQAQAAGATDCSAFNYSTASHFALTGPFAAGGASESRTVTGLNASTHYCFALTATDAAGNTSAVSANAFATTSAPSDTTPPAAVTDLGPIAHTTTSITLAWTAPGQHATVGTVASYDLRYTAMAGTDTNCNAFNYATATHATFTEALVPAGQSQHATITGLAALTNYCIALTASDGNGHISDVSNATLVNTLDSSAPSPMTLVKGAVTPHGVTFTSVAPNPNDVNPSAAAASYDLRYLAAASCAGLDFTTGTQVTTSAPAAPGAGETFTVTGLASNTAYCFAIAATDTDGNKSAFSAAVAVQTAADTTAPAAVTDLAIASYNGDGQNTAALTFTMTGDDGMTGQAAKADVYLGTNGACPLTAIGNVTLATTLSAPVAGGATQTVNVADVNADVFCFAVIVTDAAGNASAISNSPVQVKNGPTAPSALAATNITSSGLTFGWTAGSGDGTGILTATSYKAGYTLAADCSAFTFTAATPITGLPAPTASGTQQSVSVTGLGSSSNYCIGLEGLDAFGNASTVALLPVTTVVSTSGQIQAVRDAIAAALATPIAFTTPLTINGAIVSYVKGTSTSSSAPDSVGFFIQNDSTGPALYIGISPVTALGTGNGTVAIGDVLNLSITGASWQSCAACTASNSLYDVTAATITRTATGATVPTATAVTVADLLIPSTGQWALESRLISGDFTVTDAFVTASTAFQKASVVTGSSTGAALVDVRAPDAVVSGYALGVGCSFHISSVPTWRNTSTTLSNVAQVLPWVVGDVTNVVCPPLTVAAVPVTNASNVTVYTSINLTFSQPILASTVTATASGTVCTGSVQLSIDNFATCVPMAVLTTGSTTFQVTPKVALAQSTAYQLKVTIAVTNTATPPGALAAQYTSTFTTAGNLCTANALVISQIYGGGGNSGTTLLNDFVELHNRSAEAINLNGLSLQYASTTGVFSSVDAFTTDISIPAGGYFTVREAAGTGTTQTLTPADYPSGTTAGPLGLSGTAGKIALIAGTTALGTATPAGANVIDLVGWGTGTTFYEGTAAAPSTANGTSISRKVDGTGKIGCLDTNSNSADFGTATAATSASPRTAVTTPAICTCPGT